MCNPPIKVIWGRKATAAMRAYTGDVPEEMCFICFGSNRANKASPTQKSGVPPFYCSLHRERIHGIQRFVKCTTDFGGLLVMLKRHLSEMCKMVQRHSYKPEVSLERYRDLLCF